MNAELLQGMIEIVFKGHLLYLSPILFVLMGAIFSEKLIDLVTTAIEGNTNSRRSRY